jgi:hypothetical protein
MKPGAAVARGVGGRFGGEESGHGQDFKVDPEYGLVYGSQRARAVHRRFRPGCW